VLIHRERDERFTRMAVAFGLLGPLLVNDGTGTPIQVSAPKQRVILAALLLSVNTTVSAEQLADALWGASPPPTAAAAIRTYVTRLRHALGLAGARLVTRPTGYAIEVHHPGELDLAELERLRVEARQAAEAGQWSRAASVGGKALSLWRGSPLEDIPSPTLHAVNAGRLTELRLELMTARIDAERELGRDHHLVPELRRLADEHPLREHIQAQLMHAYYRCGRQADALAVYRKVRGTLADELGIEPGPELRKMHQLILTADPALSAPVTAKAG
jgi:DNA-binding SARP family transcriptional activator